MQNRTPVARDARPPLPEFEPVPRKYRHDGWTPERQRAFIEALADTGSVSRAAAMVNMAQANCYTLRRAPGAEGLRRAWDAALDFGLKRLKDIAFERAIDGQLVPVFVAGKLMGFRRKRNDALLMFCLRHYGQDGQGKRTTINYFRASAGASSGGTGGEAAASTTTVQTMIRGDPAATPALTDDRMAGVIQAFEGVVLDPEAQASIAAALEACAARAREAEAATARGGIAAENAAEASPDESFVRIGELGNCYRGELESPVVLEDVEPFGGDEGHWTMAGAPLPDWAPAAALTDQRDAGVAGVKPRPSRRRKD